LPSNDRRAPKASRKRYKKTSVRHLLKTPEQGGGQQVDISDHYFTVLFRLSLARFLYETKTKEALEESIQLNRSALERADAWGVPKRDLRGKVYLGIGRALLSLDRFQPRRKLRTNDTSGGPLSRRSLRLVQLRGGFWLIHAYVECLDDVAGRSGSHRQPSLFPRPGHGSSDGQL
jgi:hypothetical protein